MDLIAISILITRPDLPYPSPAKAYTNLLDAYPEFKPKIEQSVGHGLAILRMKHKFAFSSQYRFFY